MQSLTDFVHLRVHSAYSLAEGAIRIKDLTKLCNSKNMPAVAVTDTNNLFGAMEFALEASGSGVQPIIGAQVDYCEPSNPIVLLVQSEEGYRNLCRLVSAAYMEGGDNAVFFITPEKLQAHGEGLICLTGGAGGPLGKLVLSGQLDKAEAEFSFLKSVFGDRLYVEIQRHGTQDEQKSEPHFLNFAEQFELPIVATNDCYFSTSSMYEAHDALLCIAEGRYVSETDRRKVTPNHYFKSRQEMLDLFSDLPDAVQNTVEIAKRCHYFIKSIQPILPPFETASGGR